MAARSWWRASCVRLGWCCAFRCQFGGLGRQRSTEFELAGFGTGVEEGILRGRMVVDERFYAVESQQVAALGLLLAPLVDESIAAQDVPHL